MVKVHAPFTESQVEALNRFQSCGRVHPFTCPKHDQDLIAEVSGWRCPVFGCLYVQDWAHDFMCVWMDV
jgi:hypothetical protein